MKWSGRTCTRKLGSRAPWSTRMTTATVPPAADGSWHVLEGNHRVSQWLHDLRASPDKVTTATFYVGCTRSLCCFLDEGCPRYMEFHGTCYSP